MDALTLPTDRPPQTGPGQMEIWQSPDGSKIAVVAATWHLNPKITFESLADEFKKDPAKAWRNYGSVVTFSVQRALRDSAALIRHVNTLRSHPFDETTQTFKAEFRGRPGRRYFMHFDLSKNRDATGIALVHQEPSHPATPHLPGIPVVDFMHRVVAPFGKDINYRALRETFIYPLTERGFQIHQISFDQWNSVETQQALQERGYLTETLSADKSTTAYDTLIEQILHGHLDYYEHPVFRREMEELRLVEGKKYDHPRKGSKDIGDAVACAVWAALHYAMENPEEAEAVIAVVRRTQHQRQETSYGD